MEQAKIPNLQGLTELANRDGVDIKPTLLRVMTDLYVQKPVHTAEEEAQYIELTARLVDQVDAVTRSVVAGRLANYPGAPQVVVDLVNSERLERGEMSPDPTPAPLLPEPALVDADAAPLPTGAATPAELSELFLAADAQERRMILLHLEYAELPEAAPVPPHLVHETIRRLETAALNHSAERFAQEIERSLGIGRALARRLVDDESGEPVLVLAMALGMPADVLQRILLCLNPAISHSVLRVYELSTLYDEIDQLSASRLTAIWQAVARPAAQRTAPAAHQPVHYDEGKDKPALPARPAIRWEEHVQRRQNER